MEAVELAQVVAVAMVGTVVSTMTEGGNGHDFVGVLVEHERSALIAQPRNGSDALGDWTYPERSSVRHGSVARSMVRMRL